MNRALPPGDCGNRESDQERAYGFARPMPGAGRLVGGTKAARGPHTKASETESGPKPTLRS